MTDDELTLVDDTLARLADPKDKMSPMEAEYALGTILTPLLRRAGYQVVQSAQLKRTSATPVNAIDFVIKKEAVEPDETDDLIGLEYKHSKANTQQRQVVQILGAAMLNAFDRVVLVSNGNFSRSARAAAERALPVKIELLGYDDLKAWASSLRTEPFDDELSSNTSVRALVKAISSEFARLIAHNVEVLQNLEWRQLEETMAEVFSGLGFKTTLTPESKDGGKDLILEYYVDGAGVTFYVELKHWRSPTRVGSGIITDFLKVIVRDGKQGGLLLSTYGFTNNAFEGLTEVTSRKLHFGEKDKIASLCQYYEKAKRGLWSPSMDLGTLITNT